MNFENNTANYELPIRNKGFSNGNHLHLPQ